MPELASMPEAVSLVSLPPAFAGPVGSAWTAVRAGRMRSAHNEVTRLLRPDHAQTLTTPQLALTLLLQVELDLACGELGHATGHAGRISELEDDPAVALSAELARGEAAAAYGDHATARDHFLAAGALPGADVVLVRPWWIGAVLALVRTGRRRDGADLARTHVALAEEEGEPFALAHGLRALATADTGHDPLAMLRRARELAEEADARRLAVQLDTDIAAMSILAPGRSGPEIVPPLRRAEAYAAEEGLWPLYNRITSLLVRASEEPRPLTGAALDVLTEAEQRVARLASRSMTNREIANELGVTVKAIEWHLSRTYRKLGITSRQALVALLTEDEPPDAS
jgi:DNA-binding CsgD family transcriptional regulator